MLFMVAHIPGKNARRMSPICLESEKMCSAGSRKALSGSYFAQKLKNWINLKSKKKGERKIII